jgi:ERCC4-related helicase
VIDQLSPGAQIDVRGETWLVGEVRRNSMAGPVSIEATGTSELVRGLTATFLSDIDAIHLVRPEDTRLILDDSPMFRKGRLYIDAVARSTPVGSSDAALRTVGRALVDDLGYQQVPVHKALDMLRPRVLIADAVGLGKTIEVAHLLNELASRGAASRVLVVVPQAILEQVQHELWCRTGFPLVRLDTAGIQRMRAKIPAGRNPFAFFRRVIVSIDTIKQPGRYRPFLTQVDWDVVWIDECHSLINRHTQNSELARILSDRSDGFILTSATPHNGEPESFAELISLLDPTAISDSTSYQASDIEHLFVRRHRHSPEVEAQVADEWAERLPPRVIPVVPGSEEEALFAELSATWIKPASGSPPCSDRLFPWTLFKAACSSPAALGATVRGRLDRREGTERMTPDESAALHRLADLADAAIAAGATAKFATLLAELQALGVAPRGDGRAVIFSERVDTLHWLSGQFQQEGWAEDAIIKYHHGLDEQSRIHAIKEFSLQDSKVRLFISGDMASEGVNLHQQCHVLFHWDLPWSLIRIQQRNGRIDRYGQRHAPVITALVAMPDDEETAGDARIIAKLVEKEHAAHRSLGDAAAVMGQWDADTEEDSIRRQLASQQSAAERDAAVEQIAPTLTDADWTWTGPIGSIGQVLAAGDGSDGTVPTLQPNRIFDDNLDFVREVVAADDRDPARYEWREEGTLVTFTPQDDLKRRFDVLPTELVRGLRLHELVKVTSDKALAKQELADALRRRQKDRELNPDQKAAAAWPEVGYLTDEHPVTLWAADRALTMFERGVAPVLVADVSAPVVLCVGVWANQQGEPLAALWAGIEVSGPIPEVVCPPKETFDWLADVGVLDGRPNTVPAVDIEVLQALIPSAVEVAQQILENALNDISELTRQELVTAELRLLRWESNVRARAEAETNVVRRRSLHARADAVHTSIKSLIANMTPAQAPTVRVVAVITGEPT